MVMIIEKWSLFWWMWFAFEVIKCDVSKKESRIKPKKIAVIEISITY